MRLLKLEVCVSLLVMGCGARTTLGPDYDDTGEQGGTLAAGGTSSGGGSPTAKGGASSKAGGGTSFGSGGVPSAGSGGRGTISRGGTAAGGAGVGGAGVGGAGAGGRIGQGGVGAGGSGFGGSGFGGAASFGGSPTKCPPLLLPNEDLIDDMEDGDRFVLRVAGRAGSWSDDNDGTGATMDPTPRLPFYVSKSTNACFSNSVSVKGGPFTDWGANFGFGLGSPYNASAYSGFSFWARIDSGTGATLRVGFPERHTHPDGGLCVANSSDPKSCWDNHKARRQLTTDWTKYSVSFSELRQDSWGNQGPFDASTVYGVSFEIPANGVFSIWVDEVAFVR